ncbi:PREDICTED: uncharacterized protein LOC109226016 [Nicotiana attenuata]|uniref:uncharacterized protein LOC109226016 n=1 Tax=Nicotiana attenuata TaxID=49451 RepID=UPI000905CD14|nr:PREDICTED: uncharacterized protein LOC109226016 [Nicotiana attenuata]
MTTSTEQQNGSTTSAMATASSSHTTPGPAVVPAEKLEKFSGMDFKRWQRKIFFYLTTLSLQRFNSEDVLVLGEETPDNERFVVTEAWKHSDFLCKNYILSYLEDGLYNVYSVIETSKELWNALEKKYKTEDAGQKKFVVVKFLDFKMVDTFQVEAFIGKLPRMWKDFKNCLKHKRKEMTLEDLIVCLRIEEDNKAAEKKSRGNSTIMVGNARECWIDSGATRHVCANKEFFTSYAPGGPNNTVFMANSATAKIEGTGKIVLKMTSVKIVTLNKVLHVPEMRKNLVPTSLLVKNGFKCIFVSDKVVVSKNEIGDYIMEAAASGGIIGWDQALWPITEHEEEDQAESQFLISGMRGIGTSKGLMKQPQLIRFMRSCR